MDFSLFLSCVFMLEFEKYMLVLYICCRGLNPMPEPDRLSAIKIKYGVLLVFEFERSDKLAS